MTETLDQKQGASDAGVPPLPHHHNRKPRAREVSSRFMSPVVSSSSSSTSGDVKSPLPKHAISTIPAVTSPAESHASRYYQQQQRCSKSNIVLQQRRPQEQEPPLFCCTDETTSPTSDTPLGSHNNNNKNNRSSSSVVMSLQRKPRAGMKLYKENNNGETTVQMKQQQQHPDLSQAKGKSLQGRNGINISSVVTQSSSSSSSSRPRPDTPVVVTERIIPSRFRHSTQNFQRQTNIGAGGGVVPAGAPTSVAAKLLLSSGLSMSAQHSSSSYHDPQEARSVCDRDPEECSIITYASASSIQNSRLWSASDIMRSSMPEGDTRLLAAERSCSSSTTTSTSVSDSSNFSKFSPCSRSLNFSSLSSCCEHPSSIVHPLKTPVSVSLLSKPSAKMGSFFMPPHHPTCIKLGADARKGRKVFTHQEDVHSLKLLHNHYLQWRFANAKADLSLHAQRRETEIKICSLGVKISDLLDAVKKKRIELGLLIRIRTLSTILEAHMPYLDEWSALEEEYSTSLSGAIHSLENSLLQLPVSGHVQVDTREIVEALNSAIKMMEIIGVHVKSLMPKAEEMDSLILELARVIGGERTCIEECGDLLFKNYTSQVENYSLRGHIMQLHRSSNCLQLQEE
ncbi:hypothetical protein LguiA_025506 [Lonicera macranthoides]